MLLNSFFQRAFAVQLASFSPNIVRICPSSTLIGDAYQFLHKSEIPTYHFQPSLRRLPIPKLELTCSRYLNAIRPLLEPDDYNRTEKIVEGFRENEGKVLQKALIAHDRKNRHTSYISDPWFDMYLESRTPLPVHLNPFMMLASDPRKPFNEQLVRATNLTISIGRFKKALDARILKPEIFYLNAKTALSKTFITVCKLLPSKFAWFGAVTFKAFPLDMSQYSSLFNGTRIPKLGKDQLYSDENARHFLVLRRGHFFVVDLFDENANLLSPNEIHSSLSAILSLPLDDVDLSPAVFTTENRDTWAKVRTELEMHSHNVDTLKLVDSAVFTLCLDNLKTDDPQRLINCLLCGDDAKNRWFDKRFQLIVDENGMASVNFEHSWGDGVAMMRLLVEIFIDSCAHCFVHPGQKADASGKIRKIGRTECARSATWLTSEVVKNFDAKSSAELWQLIKQCSKYHTKITTEAAIGQGFDRHLLGLKVTAQRLNLPLPSIFSDASYKYVNEHVLSTSTLSTDTIVFGGFGPVIDTGLGIGYNVCRQKFGCVVSAYRGKRDAKQFVDTLKQSLDDIRRVIYSEASI